MPGGASARISNRWSTRKAEPLAGMIRIVEGEGARCGLEAVEAWLFSVNPQPLVRKDMRAKITRPKRTVDINRALKKMFVDLMVFITAA